MSQKRQQEQDANKPPVEEGCSSDDKRRKTPALKNVVLEVMKLRNLQQSMVPVLEPFIRKVVREEVDMALRKHLASVKQSSGKEMQLSESRSLELKFLDTISLPVFTGSRIEGEGCTTLKVALIDGSDGQVVSSGPISSSKIEIVVLEGDFDGNEGDNWTLEEFKSNLVREREGKRPILTGDAIFNLKKGIGLVGEIAVTDNSSWTRSRKFRLGARLVDNCDGIRVREAKTESFVVRDHRGELYKKHHPPSLLDEVWRLEKIGKEGAFHKRLSKENVSTVKDFLTLLFIDPARLRNILGTGMSAKMWEVTVEHAKTCVRDKRIYLYRPISPEKTGVVFDVVGQVMGLVSDSRYVSADKMSETEKAESHSLVILAFKEWDKVASFDDETSFLSSVGYTPDIIEPSSIYSMGCASSVSLICDTDSNEHLQYFHTDCCSLENPQAGYLYDHSAGAVAIDKAHRRWTMLFSVLRWFSVRRTVMARKIHVSSRETNT